jgi:hypothetical protein
MVEIQNKTLAGLMVVAIVISLVGTFGSISKLNQINTFPGITGMGVTHGNVTITVSQNLDVSFVDGTVDFGTGYVNQSGAATSCTMIVNYTGSVDTRYDANDAGGCGGDWSTFEEGTEDALRIENIGNTNAKINVTSNATAATLLGGTAPVLKWVTENYEATSCKSGMAPATYQDITTVETTLCDNLSYLLHENSISLGFLITIDENTTMIEAGEAKVNITLEGIAVA